ncbi:FAS1-like dehydratase domain-containing protein [Desertibacillus haloalkaliphilus]|uniref:FAS1-like dehydratase domain-containing protein n=1 Tax=Desertibacillus haloalkaliphilus TaxID=1328930 RepID=UPI001C275499|nr:MaoC family dehydratase N-terminal domain-containing protein [Desertibacillus haloalkaliphilus]MBU8907968.1 MaoC family dehydratase N-terminal domain-containing protein [Desertibacillus haloalkaliphilus]
MAVDKTLIGKKGPAYWIEIEKGHIRRFADAVGDESPLYTDEDYAKQTPFQGLITPPTFATILTMGQPSPLDDVPGFELRRVLHGEQDYQFHQDMRPGDKYRVQSEIKDVYDRHGSSGRMSLIIIETVASDLQENPVVTAQSTVVYRQSL